MRYYSKNNICGNQYSISSYPGMGTVWEICGKKITYLRQESVEKIIELRRRQLAKNDLKKMANLFGDGYVNFEEIY